MLKHYIVLYKEWISNHNIWSQLNSYEDTGNNFAEIEANFINIYDAHNYQIISITVSEHHDN